MVDSEASIVEDISEKYSQAIEDTGFNEMRGTDKFEDTSESSDEEASENKDSTKSESTDDVSNDDTESRKYVSKNVTKMRNMTKPKLNGQPSAHNGFLPNNRREVGRILPYKSGQSMNLQAAKGYWASNVKQPSTRQAAVKSKAGKDFFMYQDKRRLFKTVANAATVSQIRHTRSNTATGEYLRRSLPPRPSSTGAAVVGSRNGYVSGRADQAFTTNQDIYDEMWDMKKTLSAYQSENVCMKAKLQRCQDENGKYMKEIEKLSSDKNFKPGGSSSRKDSNSIKMNQLHHKIYKLEQLLKDKEREVQKVMSDIKTTTVEELKIKLDVYQQEIANLYQQLDRKHENMYNASSEELTMKDDLIREMKKDQDRLKKQNKSLKSEMQAMSEKKGVFSEERKHHSRVGEDVKKLEKKNKVLMEENAYLKDKLEHKQNEVKKLKRELDDLKVDLRYEQEKLKHSQEDNDKNDTNSSKLSVRKGAQTGRGERGRVAMGRRPSSSLSSNLKSPRPSPPGRASSKTHLIQASGDKPVIVGKKKGKTDNVDVKREEIAAKQIQRAWRHHIRVDDDGIDTAISVVQSVVRAHVSRKLEMRGRMEKDLDENAMYLQSSLTAHTNRMETLGQKKKEKFSQSHVTNSDYSSDDDDVIMP